MGYDVTGEKNNRHYVINELEPGFVCKMFSSALDGKGFVSPIEEMASAGITGKLGRPIKYPQIYEIVRNEKHTGVYLYRATEARSRADRRTKADAIRIKNALPVIIDKALFEGVQQVMKGRKHTGRKANYLCSGLVYCQCGAKMHGMTSKRKGHEYTYFTCSKKCGASVVHMDDVDATATRYLSAVLSDENQLAIIAALRQYQASAGGRMIEFKRALNKRIQDKQRQYDALMKNLASASLPPEIVADVGQQMKDIKAEIAALEATAPPKDFTTATIKSWLESIKEAPDRDAVRLLIERIDVMPVDEKQKTVFKVQSTLKTVLSINGIPTAN